MDTYNRIEVAVKANYEPLIEKLTEEFLDPQEKMKFIENFSYNRRRKGQSIKEFMQEIIKDMNRYSGMPDNVAVGGASVPNRTKIKEGVRRFKRGIRDIKGEKNRELTTHMKFHLHKDEDLTWEKALDAASRWEAANYKGEDSGSSSSDSSDEGEKVAATRSRERKKGGKTVLAAVEEEGEIATLADQVKANTMDIKGIKTEQERTSVEVRNGFASLGNGFTSLLQEIKNLTPNMNQQGQQQQQNQPQQQQQNQSQQQQQQSQQQQQNRPQPFRNYMQNRQGNNMSTQQQQGFQQRRPQNYTWKGVVRQNQQSGFGLQRSSPATYPKPTASNANGKAIAAVEEEQETVAEDLQNEDEDTVTMSRDRFMNLTREACCDVDPNDVVANLEQLNF